MDSHERTDPPLSPPSEHDLTARTVLSFPNGVKRVSAYAVATFAGLVALFLIPRLIPASPSISDSFLFGFNNRVFVLLLLVLLAAFSRAIHWHFPEQGVITTVSPRRVLTWIMIFFLACGGILYHVRGSGGFGESIYLIDRVGALAAGEVPYRDFEFAYGPLLLYLPWILTRLHLGVATAYYLFWIASTITGVWLLGKCLSLLQIPDARKNEAFTLFCLFALCELYCTGVNYSLLRFLAPVAAALHLEKVERSGNPSAFVRTITFAAGYGAGLILISPEMAFAFAFGSFCWIALLAVRGEFSTRTASIGLVVLGSVDALLFILADHLGILATLREFSRGANSFPVIPAPHVLLFLICCTVMAAYVSDRLRSGKNWRQPTLLAAVQIPLLFAAFGRCDSGHVVLNGIAVLLLVICLASTDRRVWNAFRIVFVLVLCILPCIGGLLMYQTAASKLPAARVWLRQVNHDRLTAFPGAPFRYSFLSRGPVDAPFGYQPDGLGSWRAADIDTGHFFGVENVLLPELTDEKVAELDRHPERLLLLPRPFDAQCRVDPVIEARLISVLFIYSYSPQVKHQDDFLMPLCSYIHKNYHAVQTADTGAARFSLWARNNPPLYP